MCDYCGCRGEPVIAELTEEHEVIGALSWRLGKVLDVEDFEAARSIRDALIGVVALHSLKEEGGLYVVYRKETELDEPGIDIATLFREHREVEQILTGPLNPGTIAAFRGALRGLDDHIQMEESQLFTHAYRILPPDAWVLAGAAMERVSSENWDEALLLEQMLRK